MTFNKSVLLYPDKGHQSASRHDQIPLGTREEFSSCPSLSSCDCHCSPGHRSVLWSAEYTVWPVPMNPTLGYPKLCLLLLFGGRSTNVMSSAADAWFEPRSPGWS